MVEPMTPEQVFDRLREEHADNVQSEVSDNQYSSEKLLESRKKILDELQKANRSKVVVPKAEEVPPTALPADVYLTKLEALLKENAALRSQIGYIVGRSLGVLDATWSVISNGYSVGGDYCEQVIEPFTDWLKTIKV